MQDPSSDDVGTRGTEKLLKYEDGTRRIARGCDLTSASKQSQSVQVLIRGSEHLVVDEVVQREVGAHNVPCVGCEENGVRLLDVLGLIIGQDNNRYFFHVEFSDERLDLGAVNKDANGFLAIGQVGVPERSKEVNEYLLFGEFRRAQDETRGIQTVDVPENWFHLKIRFALSEVEPLPARDRPYQRPSLSSVYL